METTKNEPSNFLNTPEIKLHFLDYWRIIRIRKTIILAVFLLVSLTATLVTYVLPESYASTVVISVEKDTKDATGIGDRGLGGGYDPYWLQTEFEKIQSTPVLYQVIKDLELGKKWANKNKENTPYKQEVAYLLLKGQLNIRQSRNTSLIEIQVASEDKEEAAVIANQIAKVYGEIRAKRRMDLTKGGIGALTKQWKEQDDQVKATQKEVDKIKDELKIPDSDAAGAGHGSTLEPEVLRKQMANLIEGKAQFEKINTVNTKLKSMSRVALKKALPAVIPDAALSELLQHEKAAQQKLTDLAVSFAPEHPEVKRVSGVLQTVAKQIDETIDGILLGVETRVASQKAEVDTVQKAVDDAKELDIRKSIERRPYFLAKRDLEGLQLIRERLNMQIIAQTVDSNIPIGNAVEVVNPAEPGLRPVKPNRPLNITLGLVTGLIIGVALAFFIEYLDTSVKTIDDVERALQAPVLGVIPQNVSSLLEEGPESPHAEAYRVLRTNVLFSRKDPKFNTMTVVSGGAGEGKTTTLFNLAVIFAQNGQRVLVVDSDLRRPSVHKLLKLSNNIGLTNLLLKQNTLEEVIQTTGMPTLDFMPSGKLPSSSMGILGSAQMKEMIRDVKRRYDFIFFDSPPIMGVSDASILSSEVDMVLQVIQYRRYPQPMTIRAKQMIEKVGGNLLGLVLNNINMAQDENYYYYSGYYYDYYTKSNEQDADPKKAGPDAQVEIKPKY